MMRGGEFMSAVINTSLFSLCPVFHGVNPLSTLVTDSLIHFGTDQDREGEKKDQIMSLFRAFSA